MAVAQKTGTQINPGKWKHGPKPEQPLLVNFEPHPNNGPHPFLGPSSVPKALLLPWVFSLSVVRASGQLPRDITKPPLESLRVICCLNMKETQNGKSLKRKAKSQVESIWASFGTNLSRRPPARKEDSEQRAATGLFIDDLRGKAPKERN